MLEQTNHYLLRGLICVVLAAANCSLAEDDRWYRVELMVFSHTGGQSAEQWDPTPVLVYPDAARFLSNAGQVNAASASQYEYSVQTAPEQQSAAGELYPLQESPTAPVLPALPTPFVRLGNAEQDFRGKAAYMQRSGRYRILFHETWLQPVTERSRALPIILDQSGDTGQWPELQGSILLSVSRYLHLETNLWLNTNGDYLPGSWQMPAPPLGPSSATEEPQESELDISTEESGSEPGQEERWQEESWQEASPEEEAVPGPIYPFRHAILLQQKRRMRSTEVHYLDHPMLGVVTKLTPLTAQDLESLARGETAL
jgi:hypothetical protein